MPEKLQTIFFLFRHGQTDNLNQLPRGQAVGVGPGWIDTFVSSSEQSPRGIHKGSNKLEKDLDGERVLTEEGSEQAKKIGGYLHDFAPTAIYSSPFKRTLETSRLIQKNSEISGSIIQRNELAEVYSSSEYANAPKQMEDLIKEVLKENSGERVVLVSHQYPIEKTLEQLGFTTSEIASPCQMGQGYRLVFAGDKPVECQKINPANVE